MLAVVAIIVFLILWGSLRKTVNLRVTNGMDKVDIAGGSFLRLHP